MGSMAEGIHGEGVVIDKIVASRSDIGGQIKVVEVGPGVDDGDDFASAVSCDIPGVWRVDGIQASQKPVVGVAVMYR
jgi:hypothetical protein